MPALGLRLSPWCTRAGSAVATVATVAVLLGACLVLVAAVASRLGPHGRLGMLGHPVLVVLSGSMAGTIDTGDLVVDDPLTAAEARQLRVGRIVTFRDAPGSEVAITHRIHRVVHRDGRVLYETKGDANPSPDLVLRPASTVIAAYGWRIPRGGRFLVNLHRPLVLGLLLLAPVLWALGATLRQLGREAPPQAQPTKAGRG